MNKEERLIPLICVLFTGASGREAEADPGGSEPCGCCHSVQRRHHGDLHSPTLLLCHCAFRQIWPDCGHQHRCLHFVHSDSDCGHAGVHGPRQLQQTPRRCAEGRHGRDGGSGCGSGSVLGGGTAGSVVLAVGQHLNIAAVT